MTEVFPLIKREAADDERKALQISRDHYASKRKPRMISLHTELTSFQKATNKSVTDYIILAETAIIALRNAEETLSDRLLIALILKGLQRAFVFGVKGCRTNGLSVQWEVFELLGFWNNELLDQWHGTHNAG